MKYGQIPVYLALVSILPWDAAPVGPGRALGEEGGVETRAYDVRDIVRTLPNAEMPGGPGERDLVFTGCEMEDLVGGPGYLMRLGAEPEEPGITLEEWWESDSVPELPFFLPWEGPGDERWQVLSIDALEATLREHLDALRFRDVDVRVDWPRLRVAGTAEAHEIVDDLLADLGREARTQIAIEGIILPVVSLDKIAPNWRATGPYLPAEVFSKALIDPRSRLLSTVARSGQRVVAGSRDLWPLVVDTEVDQTGVIPVTNPVVDTPPGGDFLMASPILLPRRGAVWLDLAIGQLRLGSASKQIGGDFGALDFPETEKAWLSTSVVVKPGTALIAGSLGKKGELVALIRVQTRGPERRDERDGVGAGTGGRRPGIASYDFTLLLRRSGRTWPGDVATGGGLAFWSNIPPLSLEGGGMALDQVRMRLGEAAREGHLSSDRARLFASGVDEERLRRAIERELEAVSKLAAIELTVRTISRSQLAALLEMAEGGVLLPDGWEDAIKGPGEPRRTRYVATGAEGQALGLFGATVKNFVVDCAQVSGGTGFAIVEVSDPVVRPAGDGSELWVQAASTSDPSRMRITVGALVVRIVEERPVVATFPTVEPASAAAARGRSDEGSGGGALGHVRTVKHLTLTLPRQDVQYWSAEVDVPPGRDAVLRVSARDGGDATVLIGRVRSVE